MKKSLSIVLTVVIMLTVLPFGLFTISTTAETNTITGSNGTYSWTLVDGVLTISGTGTIGQDLFDDSSEEFSNYPFWILPDDECCGCICAECDCSCHYFNLKTNFRNNKSIKKVIIEDGIIGIAGSVFSGCTNLESIVISDSVTMIDSMAFYNTAWYNNQPDGLVYAGKVAYRYKGDCPSSVVINEGTLGIAGNAFQGCRNLTSITIPKSVKFIGSFAFYGCYGLTEVNISDIAAWCNITDFYYYYSAYQLDYYLGSGYSYNPLYYAETLNLNGSKVVNLVIPEGVMHISKFAFINCRSISSVSFPNSLKTIGGSAFYGCSNLKRIELPNSLKIIGIHAFNYTAIENVYYQGSVDESDNIEIWYYNNLSNANWHYNYCTDSTNHILNKVNICISKCEVCGYTTGTHTYDNDSDMICNLCNNVRIPCNHIYITENDSLCNLCGGTRIITGKTGDCTWTLDGATLTISGNGKMGSYDSGLLGWIDEEDWSPSYAPWGTSITKVIIEQGVTNISFGAFYNCTKLTRITIPDSVTSIDSCAFYNCSKLISFTIPKSVTKIWYNAFYGCTNLKDVYYRGSKNDKNNLIIDSSCNCLIDATWHYNSCYEGEHIYKNGICISKCEVCDYTIGSHTYDNDCDSICNICDNVRTVPAHIYANACDAYCNVCGEIRVPSEHIYDNGCDTNCNVCGVVRTTEHQYDGDCDAICNECGFTREAQEHTYVDWIIETSAKPGVEGLRFKFCEWCGDYIEETIPAIILPTFKSNALALQSNLSVQYKVSDELVKAGYTNIYAEFVLNGVKTVVTESEYDAKNGVYIFTFSNIAPHLMNETITATICAEFDGEVYTGNKSYSVATYCRNQLKAYGGKKGYEKLSRLLVDVLNYGAAAQNYQNHNVNNLANAFLTDAQKAYGTQEDREYISIRNLEFSTITNPKAIISAFSLTLKDSITVTFKFALNNGESLDGIIANIEAVNKTWNIDSAEFEYDSKANLYLVHFKELNPAQMSKAVYMTLYKNGKAISNTACYSIESYALGKWQSTGNVKLSALVSAMLRYGDAAKAYNG